LKLNEITHTDIAKQNFSKAKKYVQTTLFPPINANDDLLKNIIEEINKIDLNSMTPIDAMKKLIEIKELTTQS
jgi:hypothetical protein